MILESIISAAVFLTGGSCAAIDNQANVMVWKGQETALTTTGYDDIGVGLLPEAQYPNEVPTLLALVHAEGDLQSGPAGGKIRVSCFKDIDGIPHELTGKAIDHDHG